MNNTTLQKAGKRANDSGAIPELVEIFEELFTDI